MKFLSKLNSRFWDNPIIFVSIGALFSWGLTSTTTIPLSFYECFMLQAVMFILVRDSN